MAHRKLRDSQRERECKSTWLVAATLVQGFSQSLAKGAGLQGLKPWRRNSHDMREKTVLWHWGSSIKLAAPSWSLGRDPRPVRTPPPFRNCVYGLLELPITPNPMDYMICCSDVTGDWTLTKDQEVSCFCSWICILQPALFSTLIFRNFALSWLTGWKL